MAASATYAPTHSYRPSAKRAPGLRRFTPSFSTGALAATVAAFMIGGLVVAIAA